MEKVFVVYATSDKLEWRDRLSQIGNYDFYHLPVYHRIAESNNEGVGELLYFQQGEYRIALPLLLRPLNTIPGLQDISGDYYDATSVYGYAGPVASHAVIPDHVRIAFQQHVQDYIQQRNIISVFSRLNTFFPQQQILSGLGRIATIGVTISVDLSLPLVQQRAQYAKGHKSDINKLQRLGVKCVHDEQFEYLAEFINIYYETMDRVNADAYYYFSMEHFQYLIEHLNAGMHLFVCILDGKVICGGLYIACQGIVQAYLGGVYSEFAPLSPRKLEKDTVRIWAYENQMQKLHLGGGVGAQKDSLYQFKSGFSKKRNDFNIWKWIANADIYHELARATGIRVNNDLYDSSFFPVYRVS